MLTYTFGENQKIQPPPASFTYTLPYLTLKPHQLLRLSYTWLGGFNLYFSFSILATYSQFSSLSTQKWRPPSYWDPNCFLPCPPFHRQNLPSLPFQCGKIATFRFPFQGFQTMASNSNQFSPLHPSGTLPIQDPIFLFFCNLFYINHFLLCSCYEILYCLILFYGLFQDLITVVSKSSCDLCLDFKLAKPVLLG